MRVRTNIGAGQSQNPAPKRLVPGLPPPAPIPHYAPRPEPVLHPPQPLGSTPSRGCARFANFFHGPRTPEPFQPTLTYSPLPRWGRPCGSINKPQQISGRPSCRPSTPSMPAGERRPILCRPSGVLPAPVKARVGWAPSSLKCRTCYLPARIPARLAQDSGWPCQSPHAQPSCPLALRLFSRQSQWPRWRRRPAPAKGTGEIVHTTF